MTIVRARRRFEKSVLEAYERMVRETRAAWAVLSMAAVDEAIERISRADEWPEDEYEQERTIEVVANQIGQEWLKEAERELGAASRDLPPLLKRLLEAANPESN